jgi:hypothetical protein
MHLRLAAPVAVLALAGAGLPAVAGTTTTSIEASSAHQVRGDLGEAKGAPTAWAAKALRAQARRLGIDAAAYRLESVRTSLIGTHVRGRQYRGDVPVLGADVLVSAVAGRVVQVDAFGTALPGMPAAVPVGAVVARAAALDRLAVTRTVRPATVDRVMTTRGDRLVDTYRVWVVSATSAVAGRVDVDAATGHVLEVVKDESHIDGTAKVFNPNPIQSTGNTALREPGVDVGLVAVQPDTDLDSAELTAARVSMPLRGLDETALTTGRLSGPWVNILGMGGYVSAGSEVPSFDLTRSDPRFEGLMAYAHIDAYQRYLQGLGLTNVNNESQDVVTTRVEGYDNSFYQPGNDIMLFGAGGVDDAEDAEVVLHEYGHAVQDAQVKGWGSTAEGGAMGEGFGDFQSGNYFARTNRFPKLDVCLMEWDSTSYASGNPTCIRRMDSKKHYPKDVQDEVHADGEMWSTFLWNVRSHLPGNAKAKSDAAIRLVITSHELLTPNANFSNAVAALRTAAKGLKHPEYAAFINAEAKKTGFPLNP